MPTVALAINWLEIRLDNEPKIVVVVIQGVERILLSTLHVLVTLRRDK
jgi:hypothetical protein